MGDCYNRLYKMPYKIFPNLFQCKISRDCIGILHSFTLKTTFVHSSESNSFLSFLQSKQPFGVEAVKTLLNKTDTTFKALVDERIIVPSEYDYMRELEALRDKVILKPPLLKFCYFIVSEVCNLGCKYCFIESGIPFNHAKKYMTADVALASATYFAFNAKRCIKPLATFYGGEPLMNFNAVKLITRIIRGYETHVDEKARTQIHMVTNGTLITSEIARFIVKNNINVGVSLDGPGYIHDLERIYAGRKKGSFAPALRGYNLLKKAGGNPGISCSISTHNVDYLAEIAEYFYSELKPDGVGFNIMLSLDPGDKRELDMNKLFASLLKVYEIFRNYGIYEDRVGRHLTPEGDLKPYYADCAGCGDQLVFLPDGKVSPCHAFLPSRKYSFGNILERAPRDYMKHPVLRLWRKRTPLNIKDCLWCPAVSICGGGCAANVYVAKGTLFKKDERNCTFFLKHFLRWYVNDRYVASLEKWKGVHNEKGRRAG